MAVYFSIKKDTKSGMTPVFIRARSRSLNVDVRIFIPLHVDARKWNGAHSSPNALLKFRNSVYGKGIYTILDRITFEIEAEFSKGVALTTSQVKGIIENIVYSEHRTSVNKHREDMTLNRYISQYISETASGNRLTDKGAIYAKSTVKSIRQALRQLEYFQHDTGRIFNFDDIDMKFHRDYTAWLRNKDYSINTIGKCITQLKVIMHASSTEGYHNNNRWKDKRFKGPRTEVDSIYLTRRDLMAIRNADISGLSPGHKTARDIFMVGVWTAQRISDYNNIRKDNISTIEVRTITDKADPKNPGKTIAEIETRKVHVITIRQKKTGIKVAVPCSSELKAILEEYDFQMPHLEDNVINRYIKNVAKAAGLTEKIDIIKTNGGIRKKVSIEKYKLIHTHTARRTGATLMYLSGMDVYDIIRITGHTSPSMLRKYIKADELEVVEKIAEKYKYFD